MQTRSVLTLLPLFTACLVLGHPYGTSARSEEGPAQSPTCEVGQTLAVQLDGIVLDAEWEGSSHVSLDEAGVELRIGSRAGTLLLALRSPLAWSPRGHLLLFFVAPSAAQGVRSEGTVRLDYEPLEHDRPHILARRVGPLGEERFTPQAAVRSTRTATATEIELAVQARELPLEEGSVRLALRWSRPGAPTDPTWPSGLDLGATPGAVPAGLRDAQPLALLTGLRAQEGPGAFPASRWAQWSQEDEEVYRRGSRAHAVARELHEEWRKAEKRDREIVPAVLENLDWIAQREPLTPHDLLARALALRFLNRRGEAAQVLEFVAQSPIQGMAYLALRELSELREAAQDYVGAAAALERALPLTAPQERDLVRSRAEELLTRTAAAAEQAAARAQDAADPHLPRVLLRTTRGTIRIVLHERDVPVATAHFLSLVEEGVYDGTFFHSVKGEGRVLGGDPLSKEGGCGAAGTGSGPRSVAMENNLRHGHWRGSVAFARRLKEENGSQFFIHVSPPSPPLDRPYTVFGHVEEGLEVLDRLEECDRLIEARVVSAGEAKR